MAVKVEKGKGQDAESGKKGMGNVDQVEKQGVILYGWDGSHFRPVKCDAEGRLIIVTE